MPELKEWFYDLSFLPGWCLCPTGGVLLIETQAAFDAIRATYRVNGRDYTFRVSLSTPAVLCCGTTGVLRINLEGRAASSSTASTPIR